MAGEASCSEGVQSQTWNAVLLAFTRSIKKQAAQLRAGDVVLSASGRPQRVTKFHWAHGTARAGGFVVLDLADLRSGARSSDKRRPDEQLELAEVEVRDMQVLYTDDAGHVHLLDPSSFDQLAVPRELFGDGRRWLGAVPELDVAVSFFQGEPVAGRVPHKVPVRVVDAPPAVVKDDGSSSRHVLVEGGISVMAPAFVRQGDIIVVRTEDASYMAKGGEGAGA